MRGHEILNNPFKNKGTAFTQEERQELGLVGLLPPYVQTLEEQAAQTYAHMHQKANDLEKRLFLMEIFNTITKPCLEILPTQCLWLVITL